MIWFLNLFFYFCGRSYKNRLREHTTFKTLLKNISKILKWKKSIVWKYWNCIWFTEFNFEFSFCFQTLKSFKWHSRLSEAFIKTIKNLKYQGKIVCKPIFSSNISLLSMKQYISCFSNHFTQNKKIRDIPGYKKYFVKFQTNL